MFRNIKVRVLGSLKWMWSILIPAFPAKTDFIAGRYSTTNNDISSNCEFCFQGNLVEVNRNEKIMCHVFVIVCVFCEQGFRRTATRSCHEVAIQWVAFLPVTGIGLETVYYDSGVLWSSSVSEEKKWLDINAVLNYTTASGPVSGPNHPPIQCVPGVKRLGREANHLPPSSTEVKNAEAITSTPHTPSWHGA
jgi:hypothetical protein